MAFSLLHGTALFKGTIVSTKKTRLLGTVIFILVALFLYYEMGVQVSPSVITGSLMRDFGVTATGLGVLSSVYFYSYTIMQIPAGLLFDRFSKRLIIPCAVAIVGFGCLFFGTTSSLQTAAWGRFLMGFGSAFAFVSVLVVAAKWFSPKVFAFLVGLAQLLAALGAMGGELPLSIAVNRFGWRSVMETLGWIGLALALLCVLIIRKHPDEALTRECEKLPVGKSLRYVLANRYNWYAGVFAFCLWGPMSIFASLWGVPYLMMRYAISNTEAALLVAMMWIGIGVISPIIGWISDLIGRRALLMWILSLLGLVASFVLVFVPVPITAVYVLLFLMGCACASQILSFAVTRDRNKKEVTATSIGLINMVLVASGALLQPLSGFILSATWRGKVAAGVHAYGLYEYHRAFALLPILYFVGFCISAFFLKEPQRKRG